MIRYFLSATILYLTLFSGLQLSAQHNCAVHFPTTPLHPKAYPAQSLRNEAYVLPVLFHVYWDEFTRPVAPTYIKSVVNKANEMLTGANPEIENVPEVFQQIVGNAQVELQFATQLPGNECTSGIVYYYHNFSGGPVSPFSNSIETSHYLNIHVYPSSNSFATFPAGSEVINDPADGIVFSTYDINFRSEILLHEIGHWLGLYHTFGPVNETGGDCGDDFVDDTPATRGTLECNPDLIDCTPGVLENVHNFMDYSTCGSMFTAGQVVRMHGILEDTDLNRNQIHQQENLEYTGVGETPDCERTIQLWHYSLPECGSTPVRYSYLVQGEIPDSVLWEFQLPVYETTPEHMPTHIYTVGGTATLFLHLYFGSEVVLEYYSHEVVVNQTPTDLPPFSSFPLLLDPDDGLVLPNEHMNLLGAPLDEGWQICDFAGFQSNQCLYVPARVVDQEGFADLEMGMFDMTGLTQPTISFRVAAAMVSQGAFHTLQILFRDECSSIFIGDIWLITSLIEISNNNTVSDFIPTSDGQWVEVNATFPEWVNSSHGIITIRLKTNMPDGFSGEPFYLDDFRLGDPENVTSIEGRISPESELHLFPNPVKNQLNWKCHHSGSHLKVFDAIGRTVAVMPINTNSGSLNVDGWSPGLYYFTIETDHGSRIARFNVD